MFKETGQRLENYVIKFVRANLMVGGRKNVEYGIGFWGDEEDKPVISFFINSETMASELGLCIADLAARFLWQNYYSYDGVGQRKVVQEGEKRGWTEFTWVIDPGMLNVH